MQAITDRNGIYAFDGLPAGNYSVTILASAQPTNGPRTRAVPLAEGQRTDEIDFGFITADVESLQLVSEDPEVSAALAFTGSATMQSLAVGLMLIGFGGLVTPGRRRRLD